MQATNKTILISRTDSIGDVVLTLPMAGFIKSVDPNIKVVFLGRTYTKDVIALSKHVDQFINYDLWRDLSLQKQADLLRSYNIDFFVHVFPNRKIARLAKLANIKNRVGTTNRLFHWFTCNRLVPLSRKNSDLHEAQLNLKLLSFLNHNTLLSLKEIPSYYGFENIPQVQTEAVNLLDKEKIKIILHPKSKGSAKEWGLENFARLIDLLPKEKFQIFISGTKEDGEQMPDLLSKNSKAIDLTGKLNLAQYIVFIAHCDVLVAASTGPLHIAAALSKQSIGLFVPKRPMHPGRWGALGAKAKCLVFDSDCEKCKNGEDCDCIKNISPQLVIDNIK